MMNKTQRLRGEIMDELTQYVNQDDARYFADWLLTHYKIGVYEDVVSIPTPITEQFS